MAEIRRLPDEVVSRIAAGEVIIRPANALKELIENSIDAGSRSITIKCERGGLDLIRIEDNGSGIGKEYLQIVCERFTTSKLTTFDDLRNMRTFGFRGEALSALSQVSKVCIKTKTANDIACAYEANYLEGQLIGTVKPCSGLNGTIINATELFYNWPARLNGFKNIAEENHRIADIVTRFAVHRPDISFAFSRGDDKKNFRTKGDGDRKAVIASLLGPQLTKEMIEFTLSDSALNFSLESLLTRPASAATSTAVNAKKLRGKTFFLYINNRIVLCNALKHAMDAIFAQHGVICSFSYMSMQIDVTCIDVNVHPTKESVIFLHEDLIIERIKEKLDLLIKESFNLSPSICSSSQQSTSKATPSKTNLISSSSQINTLKNSPLARRPHETIRTDHKERTLEQFMSPKARNIAVELIEDAFVPSICKEWEEKLGKEVQTLDIEIKTTFSPELIHFFKKMVFVGAIDCEHILMQNGPDLYIVDFHRLMWQFFYEMAAFGCGNHGCFDLQSYNLNVEEILLMLPSNHSSINRDEAIRCLTENKDWLFRYFGVGFSLEKEEKLALTVLPSLVHGFCPQLEFLPHFLAEILEIGLSQEGFTVRKMCIALANFFVLRSKYCVGSSPSQIHPTDFLPTWSELIQHVLLPKMKDHLLPPKSWVKEDGESKTFIPFVQLTSTSQLYKVFERC